MANALSLSTRVINLCRTAIGLTIFLGWTASSVIADAKNKDEALRDSNAVIEEVLIYGRKQQQRGRVFSASEGLVGYQDFKLSLIHI